MFLKLIGTHSEIRRKYAPPEVNPNVLGKIGEDKIKKSFLQERKINVPEAKTPTMRYSARSLEKKLWELTNAIESNINLLRKRINEVSVQSEPLINSAEGKKLKEEHGIKAIIQTLEYTTIPHHLVGEIDFVGIREDRSIVIIEAKNKSRVGRKDRFQLEYYIHGISKQYNYNKFYQHKEEIMGQLYPSDYTKSLKFARIRDLVLEEGFNCLRLVKDFISNLSGKELEKLKSIYGETDVFGLGKAILYRIESFSWLENYGRDLEEKADTIKKRLEDEVSFLKDISTRDLKEGLLVDTRRGEVEEIRYSTDFDSLTRGVWEVKRNAYSGIYEAEKVLTACSHCSFKGTCKSSMLDKASDPSKSITSIAHRGFYDAGFLRSNESPSTLSPRSLLFQEKDSMDQKELQRLSLSELLPRVLEGTEWPFREGLLKKRGWKQLYEDALISKKFDKEFDFWKV